MNWSSWVEPCRGVVDGLPGTAVRTSGTYLLRYGSELSRARSRSAASSRLRARVTSCTWSRGAGLAHENISRPTVFLHEQLLSGDCSPRPEHAAAAGRHSVGSFIAAAPCSSRGRGCGASGASGSRPGTMLTRWPILPSLVAGVVAHSIGEFMATALARQRRQREARGPRIRSSTLLDRPRSAAGRHSGVG